MAQWSGFGSGNTHATRVEDLEDTLREAIAAFRSAAAEQDRQRTAKSVRKLAKRLLSARLKMFKARLSELQPLTSPWEGQGIESLKNREARTRAAGLNGILAEFGAEQLAE